MSDDAKNSATPEHAQRPDKPYLSTPELDALALSQTELLSELWILRDRVTVLEYLLTQAGILKAGAIDDFELPADLAEDLDRERDQLVARIVGAGHRKKLDLDTLKKQS
ncbi:MAG: hypothetical protein AAGB27_02595 [Pseudomonadota bacterium]